MSLFVNDSFGGWNELNLYSLSLSVLYGMTILLRPVVVFVISTVALTLSVALCVFVLTSSQPRIGIVRIQKVLERYEGALDAKVAFRETTMGWGANVDTLKSELQRITFEYEQIRHISPKIGDSLSLALRTKQAQIEDYQRAVSNKTSEEQQILTDGVIAQVRTSAEKVAKTQGVGALLAIQDDGMLVYCSDAVDMTDVVLDQLRTTYRGQFRTRSPRTTNPEKP